MNPTAHSQSARGPADRTSAELAEIILRQSREAADTSRQFFGENADRIAACCAAMAKSFDQGGH